MISIEEYCSGEEEWNNYIISKRGDYRQLYNWGKFKEKTRWKILRLKISDKNNFLLFQITYKKIGLFCFCYIPGGVAGGGQIKIRELLKFLKKKLGFFFYFRIDDSSTNLQLNNFYLEEGWKRPLKRNNDCISAIFYTQEELFLNYSISHRNFKKNLKRSKRFNIQFNINGKCPTDDMLKISNYMSRKKVTLHTAEEFDYMKNFFQENSYYCVAYDENLNPVSYRTIIYVDETAWEIGGATNEKGREMSAGFSVFDNIVNFLKNKKIKYYHLGSLDKKIPGVYQFKDETGARHFNYVGEYEYTNLSILKILVNCFAYILYSRKLREIFPFISKFNI